MVNDDNKISDNKDHMPFMPSDLPINNCIPKQFCDNISYDDINIYHY